MSTVRIRSGDTERIQTPAVKSGALVKLTGLGLGGTDTMKVSIQRVSDGFWYDFDDDTFEVSGWTKRQESMTEVSATLAPGEYRYDFDTSAINNAAANDTYMILIEETGGTAKNVPFHGEIKVDQWVDTWATPANVTASTAAIIAQGDAAWISAVGFATPADVAASTAVILAAGANWVTADLTGIATAVDVNAARDAILVVGDAGPWTGVALTAAQSIQLQESWTALGLNKDAPASFDFVALFMQALANVTPIDVVLTVNGTTVVLTRQP